MWFPPGNDRATRLAGVILFWNVAQHFYPYFDVVGTDWTAQLPVALRRAAEDRDVIAFERTLQRLVARLRDGFFEDTSSTRSSGVVWWSCDRTPRSRAAFTRETT